ncbi:hypothetical protein KDK_55850 [Dictyobacter kobayashii]|uniref:Uncharacterized protein n=1 Tax=Dictyobacter kobayashii TaxID=2014872 RepID=A0A402ARQ3_9CHLR|nr:hypothetical protein KDK_55850 [Dictyobacter kobayashii]
MNIHGSYAGSRYLGFYVKTEWCIAKSLNNELESFTSSLATRYALSGFPRDTGMSVQQMRDNESFRLVSEENNVEKSFPDLKASSSHPGFFRG